MPGDASSGGMYLSATIYDEQKGQKFKVRANEDEIRVFPQSEDFGLGTFYRFYEFICENVDHNAEVVVDE